MSLFLSSSFWIVIVLSLLPVQTALAWGRGGHDAVTRQVLDRLPDNLRNQLTPDLIAQTVKDGHYPDSFEPFDRSRIGAETVERLARLGVNVRYDLHSDYGRAVAFCMLVEALRESNLEIAMFWIACLAHSTADMVACNHDPLIHVATYAWAAPGWNLMLAHDTRASSVKPMFDLAWAAQAAPRTLGETVNEMVLKDHDVSSDDQLLRIMLYGIRGARYCAPRGKAVLATAIRLANEGQVEDRQRLVQIMADLGAWAVVRTVRDVEVAQRLASGGGAIPQITQALQDKYNQHFDELMREASILRDGCFKSVWQPMDESTSGAVGVLFEPSWRMNESFFGFGSRYLSAAIAGTLKSYGRRYATFDVRDVLTNGLPDPKRLPVLVICASSLSTYRWMTLEALDRQLTSYLNLGGRVVWVNGRGHPRSITAINPVITAMVAGDQKHWLIPATELTSASLTWSGPGSLESWAIVHNPETSAGWHRPRSPHYMTALNARNLKEILRFSHKNSTWTVGAAWPSESPQIAVLPECALFPYVLTDPSPLSNPEIPQLDDVGWRILSQTLATLNMP